MLGKTYWVVLHVVFTLSRAGTPRTYACLADGAVCSVSRSQRRERGPPLALFLHRLMLVCDADTVPIAESDHPSANPPIEIVPNLETIGLFFL